MRKLSYRKQILRKLALEEEARVSEEDANSKKNV